MQGLVELAELADDATELLAEIRWDDLNGELVGELLWPRAVIRPFRRAGLSVSAQRLISVPGDLGSGT